MDILADAIETAKRMDVLISDTISRSYNMGVDHAIANILFEKGKDKLIDETLEKIIIKLQKLKS